MTPPIEPDAIAISTAAESRGSTGSSSGRGRLQLLAIATLAAVALSSAGCVMMASPEISSMKDSIERDLGAAHFEREATVTLGRLSLGLGKFVLNRLSDPDEDLNVLRGVKKVEVGVYVADRGHRRDRGWHDDDDHADTWGEGGWDETDDLAGLDRRISGDRAFRLERVMRERGWIAAVTLRQGDERTWVYYRTNSRADRLRGVYVVALEGDELTLVRLTGRLDRALEAAISLSRQYAAGEDPLL
ncbi:MAG TPA: hypothetical protein VMT85_18215 [Thermoanaerobaculia bacterium]|nr:hypothetical protein [Thermoanaerobaculia bacterium]